jgi:hypothetical protein
MSGRWIVICNRRGRLCAEFRGALRWPNQGWWAAGREERRADSGITKEGGKA